MRDEFSVYFWDRDGGQHEELRFVGPEAAMRAMQRLTQGPAAMIGMVKRVIITDGGDYCCYEWRDGKVMWDGRESPSLPWVE